MKAIGLFFMIDGTAKMLKTVGNNKKRHRCDEVITGGLVEHLLGDFHSRSFALHNKFWQAIVFVRNNIRSSRKTVKSKLTFYT